nr:MAG TPA: hypothetical protein [Caudoviricetes sp.]
MPPYTGGKRVVLNYHIERKYPGKLWDAPTLFEM